jgi:uncharacterized protein (TIGR02444 family)
MTSAFWTWLNQAYHRPGVSPALIELQDAEGLNVNALMLCCWLACRHARLSPATAAVLEHLSGAWSDAIVAPIRASRRALKTTDLIDEARRKEIRGRVQEIEIALEEIHAALLEESAAEDLALPEDEPEAIIELASDNARAYFAARNASPADAGRIVASQAWQTIVKATCVE